MPSALRRRTLPRERGVMQATGNQNSQLPSRMTPPTG